MGHTQAWLGLWQRLFVQYRDGFNVTAVPNMPDHGPEHDFGGVVPHVEEIGYDAAWYGRIAADTGDRYRVRGTAFNQEVEQRKINVLNKGVHPAPAAHSMPIVV